MLKIRNKWFKMILCALVLIAAPIILNFILLLPAFVSEQLIIGTPQFWLEFWPIYIGAIGTFLMAIMTFKTLKQNAELIKNQNTPKLSCSLAVGKDCIYIEIKNTASVPAHNVKIDIVDNTKSGKIYDFDSLRNHLANMAFELSPFEIKQIPIRGVQPYVDGDYNGFLTVTLIYNDISEVFNLYLKEINVTAWRYQTRDVCSSLKDINSSIDDIKRKI